MPAASPVLPDGWRYESEFLCAAEERSLLRGARAAVHLPAEGCRALEMATRDICDADAALFG